MLLEKFLHLIKSSTAPRFGCAVFSSSAFAEKHSCALPTNIRIKMYGEVHDFENADKLWRQLFMDAYQGKTRLLLEAIQSEASPDIDV